MKKIVSYAYSCIALALTTNVVAQTNLNFQPDDFVTISENSGGFTGLLDSGDRFSRDHDVIGDVDNDGILDLIIGARSDDDGAIDAGAAYILFMNTDGTVKNHQKISMTEGGFEETLLSGNFFGYGVAGIGDYNNDDIPDIAVSAPATGNQALYIIHLNRNGTVKSYVKNSDIIAQGLSAIGDLDGDGKIDLVACNPNSDIGGTNRGAIDILFLNENSRVRNNRTVTIASNTGGFGGGLADEDSFGGREVTMLGDLDNDGNKELAVGSFTAEGGKGAIWILSLSNTDYNVISKRKITEGLNGFDEILDSDENPNGTSGAQFGHAMCSPGDLNGDGINDLITGANQQSEGWAYIIYLNANKTVKSFTRINNNEGGFNFNLADDERFSRSISFIGDLKGDGSIAVNIGGGAGTTGVLYLLFFKPCEYTQEPGFNFWADGTTLFTNWSHINQTVTEPLSFEQCALKAQETDAAYITFQESDGRCICKADDAILTESDELSSAFINTCYSGFDETLNESSTTTVTIRKANALAYGIDGNHGGDEGQDIYLWEYNEDNINQQWVEIAHDDDYFSFQKKDTNYCIDGGDGGANGQNVVLGTCENNNQNQHWKKVDLGDGKYRLEKRNAPGFSIDGNHGGKNRQSIYLWASNDSNQNQQWVFNGSETLSTKSITDITSDKKITIYPVPVKDELYLSTENPESILKIEIIDMNGRILFSQSTITNNNTQLDTSSLTDGMYIFRVFEKNTLKTTTIPFVK